jgi:L-asparaginase II
MSPRPSDPNPVLVEALRGSAVESWHRGSIAVVDADGTVLAALGDIERPVYPRSAIKILQALPLVASGAADTFGLVDEELALACASHNGEPFHVETAARVLAKSGLEEGALECGAHWPYHEEAARALAAAGRTPSPLHNNCSGKHAGFVCLGCHLARKRSSSDRRQFVSGYVRPDHAVMQEVNSALEATTGERLADAPMGIDGCSIPTYALPLRSLGLAFARVATGRGLAPDLAAAAKRLRQAVARAPRMVAGTGRFDTRVMERLGERVYCKVGAEGVYGAALPGAGLGIAIKVDDGNTARACEVAMAAAIEALVALDVDERHFVRSLSALALRNWRGVDVGQLVASEALREALAGARRA